MRTPVSARLSHSNWDNLPIGSSERIGFSPTESAFKFGNWLSKSRSRISLPRRYSSSKSSETPPPDPRRKSRLSRPVFLNSRTRKLSLSAKAPKSISTAFSTKSVSNCGRAAIGAMLFKEGAINPIVVNESVFLRSSSVFNPALSTPKNANSGNRAIGAKFFNASEPSRRSSRLIKSPSAEISSKLPASVRDRRL